MDVNGTRFHLLLGKDDWSRCTGQDGHTSVLSPTDAAVPSSGDATGEFHWDSGLNLLLLQPRQFEFVSSPFDIAPVLPDRRGAGSDRFGNWYWIDKSEQNILVNSTGTVQTSHFWGVSDTPACGRIGDGTGFMPMPSTDPAASLKLSGLVVTEDHYLVVGTVQPGGLLIFDLYGGGPPQRAEWSKPFVPFDMAPRPGGGLLVLDRVNRCVWTLDRSFKIVSATAPVGIPVEEFFQPNDGQARRLMPQETSLSGISLDEAPDSDPIALEALPDGTVLILELLGQEPYSRISRYSLAGDHLGRVDLKGGNATNVYTVTGHDMAYVPEQSGTKVSSQGRLYVADKKNGNQSFVFTLTCQETDFTLEFLTEYLPMRLFGGKGIVTAGAQVYYDFSDRWIPLIRQNRPRYVESATLLTPCWDGREPDCVWHRLLLDADIPPETAVKVRSRAANEKKDDVPLADWQDEPAPYRRRDGSEVPYLQMVTGMVTWESLFQKARGRYLQLEITLAGNGRATPRLRAVRASYPRFSYLDHYLPAVYRDDSSSASFLDRFLANFEGIYTTLEEKIAAAQILIDPQTTPSEALQWLAGWFGISLDPSWDERRQRLFTRHAMEFFQNRGTIRGLQMALRLALDECVDDTLFTDTAQNALQQSPIRIVERFRTRRTPGIVFGDPGSAVSGPSLVTPATRWTPDQKRDELRSRYSRFLETQTVTGLNMKEFPVTMPDGAQEAALWRQFCQETLGFVLSASNNDLHLWQDFLARRYRTIAECNTYYDSSWSSFDEVPLPSALPPDGAPLIDWYQFESVVLPMHRFAHQFTVLLPTPLSGSADTTEYQRRLDLATRIVKMEKPAHTIFSVKFYWAMFRVGEARVGYDTVVDQGSRAPEFMAAMVLGRQHVGESFIGSLHPPLQDRYALGETVLK